MGLVKSRLVQVNFGTNVVLLQGWAWTRIAEDLGQVGLGTKVVLVARLGRVDTVNLKYVLFDLVPTNSNNSK